MNRLIKRHRDEGVLTLTFNRLDKRNALNAAMYVQLAKLLQNADEGIEIGAGHRRFGPHWQGSGFTTLGVRNEHCVYGTHAKG